jgi:hypothetical protein
MTTTEHIESFKANLQSSANHIGRGLSRRALLGHGWRANGALSFGNGAALARQRFAFRCDA